LHILKLGSKSKTCQGNPRLQLWRSVTKVETQVYDVAICSSQF